MANYSNYLLQKAKMGFEAANAKPEKPRFGEEAMLNNAMFNMDRQMPNENDATVNLITELQEGSKPGKVMSAGDALLAGVKAGVQRKSILDDKKRYQKFMTGMEKLKAMVDDTNRELYKQEKIYNATESIMPRLMSFMKTQKNMDANAKRVFLQNTLEEYNQAAGTDYKLLAYDGVEPWKVTISDGNESQFLDLMSLMKTPAQHKYEMYIENSPELRQAEALRQQEDALDRQVKQSNIDLHKAHANKYNTQTNQQEEATQRKASLEQQGSLPQGSLLFEEIADPTERKLRLEELKAEREKLQPTEAGIKALEEMDTIFRKYPKLSTSLAKWANAKEESLIGNFIKNVVNKDERDALLQLEKHAATLALGTIQQFKGQRPTDILKKLIKDTNPGSNFTYEAFVPIKNQYMEQFQKQRAKSVEANNGWNNRYFPSYENVYANQASETQAQPKVFKFPKDANITPEELETLKQAGIEVVK